MVRGQQVLALDPDPDVARSLARIAARGASVRTMRGSLAELRRQCAAGASADEIAASLKVISLTALRSELLLPPAPRP